MEEIKTEMQTEMQTDGKIDWDVIETATQNKATTALADDIQARRILFNCFCELLSQLKEIKKSCDEFAQDVSVCSQDKLLRFFRKVNSKCKKVQKAEKELKNEPTSD